MANLSVARFSAALLVYVLMLYLKICAADLPSISLSQIKQPSQPWGNTDNLCSNLDGDSCAWDQSKFSPEQYQSRFCGRTCVEDDIRISSDSCPTIQCFDCMCDRPACDIYGICCPTNNNGSSSAVSKDGASNIALGVGAPSTATTENQDSQTSQTGSRTSPLEFPVLECEAYGTNGEGYLFIHSCPSHFIDSQTRKLCEQDIRQVDVTTLDQFARATDTETRVTYYNKYCALCNNVDESHILQWNVSVDCEHFLFVYGATSFDQFLSYSLRPNSTCVVQHEPLVQYLTSCRLKWFRSKDISSCNETGLWRIYDDDVERACLQMDGRSHSVYLKKQGNPGIHYKNIFCAICNMADYPDCRARSQLNAPMSTNSLGPALGLSLVKPPTPVLPPLKRQQPFRLILGLHRKRAPRAPVYKSAFTFSSCKTWEWPSPDGSCLNLHCSTGKVFRNTTCVTAVPQIRGLGYTFSMWFESDSNRSVHSISNRTVNTNVNPNSSQHYLKTTLEYFEDKIRSQMNASDNSYELTLTAMTPSHDQGKSRDRPIKPSLNVVAVWVQVMVTADRTIPRDDFEMRLANFTVSIAKEAHLELGLRHRFVSRETDPKSLCSRAHLTCNTAVSLDIVTESKVFTARGAFLKPEECFVCQYVQFNSSVYTVEQDTTKQASTILPVIKAYLNLGSTSTRIVFTENSELNRMSIDKHNILRVCRDVLDAKLAKIEEQRQKEFREKHSDGSAFGAVEKAQYYLTIILLSASMICLLLTLVTYFSFKVLRNQAGLNNIFLCGSLLVAQAFLLISSHVSGPRPLCTVVGMLTHFMWLWMFVWSFICCLHMFRVFTMKTTGHTTCTSCCCGPDSRLLYKVALSLACPAAVVSLVVILSLVTSAGTRTGYGRDYCYLDSSSFVAATVVLPLGLVTLCNIIFFGITVVKIHRTRKQQSREFLKKSDKTNLYIYIKLSSITGVFWFLHLLAEGLDNDVLRFFSIITNSLQGVYIFVSYICNKRVLNMYVQRLKVKALNDTKSTSGSTDSQSKGRSEREKPPIIDLSSTTSGTDTTVTKESTI